MLAFLVMQALLFFFEKSRDFLDDLHELVGVLLGLCLLAKSTPTFAGFAFHHICKAARARRAYAVALPLVLAGD